MKTIKNKFISNSFILLVFMMALFMLTSCAEEEKRSSEFNYNVYYIDKSGNKLIEQTYNIESKDSNVILDKLIGYLQEEDEEGLYINVLNEIIRVNNYSQAENIIYLDLSNGYVNLLEKDELLTRAALVLTLTQVEGVDFVGINVNNQPLMFKNNTVSLMKASDFADVSGESILENTSTEVTLYFANKTGDKLKNTKVEINYNGSTTLEKYIVQKLIDGPKMSGYYRTLPANCAVLDAFTRNGICYVYFDSAINDSVLAVKDDIMIYSVVNSLSELTYINKVQIIIDGDPSKKLHETYAINKAFNRNLDIVETEEKE